MPVIFQSVDTAVDPDGYKVLFRPDIGSGIALDLDCCCEACCYCPGVAELPHLCVRASGAVSTAGRITVPRKVLPNGVNDPDSGDCVTFTKVITLSDLVNTCGGFVANLLVTIHCRLDHTVTVHASFPAGNCSSTPASGDFTPDQISCDPLYIMKEFRTNDIIPGFCPCGHNQPFILEVDYDEDCDA